MILSDVSNGIVRRYLGLAAGVVGELGINSLDLVGSNRNDDSELLEGATPYYYSAHEPARCQFMA